MSKIPLVIKREYLSRVKNRAFILTTILTPLLFVGLIFGAAYLSIAGKEKLKIAVIDENGFFKGSIKSDSDIVFEFPAAVDSLNYLSKGYSALLHISKIDTAKKQEFYLRSQKSIGLVAKGTIEDRINAVVEDNMLQKAGIQRATLDSVHQSSHIASLKLLQETDSHHAAKETNQGLAMFVGYSTGTLIYITLLIYGMMLMRGVMEEKTNRIAEIIVSSVKPFELMMGKIIGIGAVGLTQFVMWIALGAILISGVQLFVPHDTMAQVQTMQQHGGVMPGGPASGGAQFIYNTQHTFGTGNWPLIIGCFIFYFFSGYLFYAALFAAIGCVVEDIQSSQSLTLPVTMPVIFSFIIGTNAVQVPDSPIAVWASMVPFSSPIVMMCRIAYGVPIWQLATSMVLLIGGFLFTTWLAGKIYRTGILMYGKKTTWKEMFKWAFRKS